MDLTKIINYDLSEKIYNAWEEKNKKQSKRGYLGISMIGNKCDKFIWLYFRQAFEQSFLGRISKAF